MSSAFALKKNKYHIENRMIYVNTCFRNFFSWQKFHGRDYNRQVIDKSFLFGFSFHFDLDKHDVLIIWWEGGSFSLPRSRVKSWDGTFVKG